MKKGRYDNSDFDRPMELARAFIKIQHYHQRWLPIKGLFKGTIFPELYRPYGPHKKYGKSYSKIRRVKTVRPVKGGKWYAK